MSQWQGQPLSYTTMENGGLCISDFSPMCVVLLGKSKYNY